MIIKFTDSQKLACDISRNIAVTAGAGSGKTSVLVERYLWCLENNNYQVQRIVAITFTEKAAGEMLGRIRKRILENISNELRDAARWEDVLEELPLAHISTIHGFCQRLLREFPIEARVDPEFEVYDEALKRIRMIFLLDDFIQERAASDDPNIRILSELWKSPLTLRNILVHLIEIREKSLPWAEQITQETCSNYLSRIDALVEEIQGRGIRRLTSDQQWQEQINGIRVLIPPNDNSKLTSRCLNILDYDQEFRHQTRQEQQLLTLQMLRKEFRMVAASKKWKEDDRNTRLKDVFSHLKTLYDRNLPDYRVHAALEESGFQMQQALAELFLAAYELFRQDKAARRLLDFDDLQERTLLLLQNPTVQALLERRYDYILVDEFQDTNQLQWGIIETLGRSAKGFAGNRFCVVGDEKQSIYMFRGADVSVFEDVRRKLQQINAEHHLLKVTPLIPEKGELPQWQGSQLSGEIVMAENFRSSQPLLSFFNYLFASLFLPAFDTERPYDVPHQKLIAGKQEEKDSRRVEKLRESGDFHPVEFLLVNQTEDTGGESPAIEEAELVALRILEMVNEEPETSDPPPLVDNTVDLTLYPRRPRRGQGPAGTPGVHFKDIAILLRTRTRLKEFENALRRHGIPFIVAGGIGFFQQQEIYDFANLLRVLVDHRQDIALAGVLRSPLFNFSDDQLLYAATGTRTEQKAGAEAIPKQTLWDMLRHHAHAVEGDARIIPEELDPPKFLYVFKTLNAWKTRADRIPITHLLRQILDDTGLYGILAADRRNIQAITNIEKLLDLARNFENEGFQSLSDFVMYLDQLIEIQEREGEAQVHTEGMDVVQLMTIHAAKGLEFPVVFVPESDAPFNYGFGESVYIDALSAGEPATIAAGVKGLDPEQNFASDDTILRQYLRQLNQEKTDAEMKRVLYVACTRAREQLILSGTLSNRLKQNSWLAWLLEIFPLKDSLSEGKFTISATSTENGAAIELQIPVRTDISGTPPNPPQGGNTLPDLPQRGREEDSSLEGGKGGISEEPSAEKTSEFAKILHENLHPLKDRKNEVFSMSPSTLHLLFQCPRRYYYQQALQLHEPPFRQIFIPKDEQAETDQQQSFGKRRGTIIHKLFEARVFDADWTEEERLAAIARLPDVKKLSLEEKKSMNLDAAIRNAYNSYLSTGLKALLANSPEVHREYGFQLKLGQAHISGIIDVLFMNPEDNTWTILDYKSNEIEAREIEAEIQKHGYDIQMQIYALAVARLLQTEQVRSILFFTVPGVRYEEIDLSPNALKNVEVKMANYVDKLSAEPIAMRQDGEVCEACEYRLAGIC